MSYDDDIKVRVRVTVNGTKVVAKDLRISKLTLARLLCPAAMVEDAIDYLLRDRVLKDRVVEAVLAEA